MWEPGVVASLLTVWSHIKPRSRERGGRTPPQKGGNRCKLPTTPDRAVCPSGSRFRSIAKDLGSLREMPSFALSRRQRGFESRWGHKFKSPLTRPNTTTSQPASPRIDRQGRARRNFACAGFGRPLHQPFLLAQGPLQGGCRCGERDPGQGWSCDIGLVIARNAAGW